MGGQAFWKGGVPGMLGFAWGGGERGGGDSRSVFSQCSVAVGGIVRCVPVSIDITFMRSCSWRCMMLRSFLRLTGLAGRSLVVLSMCVLGEDMVVAMSSSCEQEEKTTVPRGWWW